MSLPTGYTARTGTRADAAALGAVFDACEEAYSPEPISFGEAEVVRMFERAEASIVVTDEAGAVVGGFVPMLRGESLGTDAAIRPGSEGVLAPFLLEWLEQQAGELDATNARVAFLAAAGSLRDIVLAGGYQYVRSFYRMVVDLDETSPAASWPHGIAVSPLQSGEELVLYEVVEDSFAEHWGHVRRSFEDWFRGRRLEPDLIFLAREAGEVAGVVMCNEDRFGVALVDILGVRKPWRGRGLGRALLLHAFTALHARGKRRIGLGVDAGNETGAVRLYESVGMRVAGQDDVYEKRM